MSSPIEVYSSDEDGACNGLPTTVEVYRRGQKSALSQGIGSGSADIVDSRKVKDEQAGDCRRGLWRYATNRPAFSQEESPLKRARAAIDVWSQGSPVLNTCRRLASDLPGKTVKVLLPCGGIDAPGWAARALGVTFDVVGYYDTDPKYAEYMANVGVEPSRLHVGKERGDFARLALSQVPLCNLLVAGPPCPPFSRAGQHKRFEDHRSHVFFHIISVIGHCATTQPDFSCFVLENVTGMLDVPGGRHRHPCRKRPIDDVVDQLYQRLGRSDWMLRVHKLDAKDFGLAQSRPRVYITGIRQIHVAKNMSPLTPERFRLAVNHEASRGMPNLADIMDRSLPPTSSHALTELQHKTIRDNKKSLHMAMDDASNKGRVAVCKVSRSSEAKWGVQHRWDGLCCCLTTCNTDLYAFSLGEGHANPALSHDRFLTVNERCLLQGFPPLSVLTALGLPEKHAVHALGNAMAVPVIGAVMASVLHGLDPNGVEPGEH